LADLARARATRAQRRTDYSRRQRSDDASLQPVQRLKQQQAGAGSRRCVSLHGEHSSPPPALMADASQLT